MPKSKVSIYGMHIPLLLLLCWYLPLLLRWIFLLWGQLSWVELLQIKKIKLLQNKEVRKIKRRSESKNLPFHTFIDFKFYMNIFYANMKVPFETVQVVLSRNHQVSFFMRFLLKNFYKVPTDEPVWKWRAKTTPNSELGSRGNLRGYKLKVVWYCCSGLTWEGNFKIFIFL